MFFCDIKGGAHPSPAGGIVGDVLDHHGVRVHDRECCASSRVGARTWVKCATGMVQDE